MQISIWTWVISNWLIFMSRIWGNYIWIKVFVSSFIFRITARDHLLRKRPKIIKIQITMEPACSQWYLLMCVSLQEGVTVHILGRKFDHVLTVMVPLSSQCSGTVLYLLTELILLLIHFWQCIVPLGQCQSSLFLFLAWDMKTQVSFFPLTVYF